MTGAEHGFAILKKPTCCNFRRRLFDEKRGIIWYCQARANIGFTPATRGNPHADPSSSCLKIDALDRRLKRI